jgi:signal peptidase I
MPADDEPTEGFSRAAVPTVEAPTAPPPAPPSPPTGGDGGRGEGGGEGDGAGSELPPPSKKKQRSLQRTVLEWVLLLGGAFVIALLIKTFLFQAFYIPSESMVPTLETNDRVLVNKLSYKLHDVNRGDIVVFETPEGESSGAEDLVKRVIGLPGEEVSGCEETKVCIDGRPLDEPYLTDDEVTTKFAPVRVPAGSVFMMGDNRDQSKDSRSFGPIDQDSIVGRVFIRIWPPNRVGLL